MCLFTINHSSYHGVTHERALPPMTSAECLFNTAVPLTVRSAPNNFNNFNNSNNFNNNFYSAPPFFTTNVTPVQFQDDQGRRVNSVVVEIYLHTIVANKKVKVDRSGVCVLIA